MTALFAFGTSTAFANTYGDSAYGSNRYSGDNSTTTAPTAPLSVNAIAGNAQATITFSPPASNGGSAITGYTAISSPGDFIGSGASSPIIITGLENGTSYTFVMTATNSVGVSATSSSSNTITPTAPVINVPRNSGGGSDSRRRLPRPTTGTPTSPQNPAPSNSGLNTGPLQPGTGSQSTPPPNQIGSPRITPQSFTRDLQTGAKGSDVKELQRFLNVKGFAVAPAGPGSAGNETDLFGPATRAALIRFQQENGIVPASGYFGPKTLALISSLSTGSIAIDATGTPTNVPTETTQTGETNGFGGSSSFGKDLQSGKSDQDVRTLQKFLNARGFTVAQIGPGSAGSETDLFGPATKAALMKFQAENSISPAAGYFGPVTRNFINSLVSTTGSPVITDTIPGDSALIPAGDTVTPSEAGVSTTTPAKSSAYTRDLQTGDEGPDVKELQKFLNSKGFPVAQAGIGSTGNETETFGGATREALVRFQKENGIVPASGYFGPRTREVIERITNQ